MKQIYKHPRQTLTIAADATSANFVINRTNIRGYLVGVVVKMPNWTNDVTGTLAVSNGDDNIYSKATIARNATTIDNPLAPAVDDTLTVTLTLSGVPGGTGGSAYVTLYFEE